MGPEYGPKDLLPGDVVKHYWGRRLLGLENADVVSKWKWSVVGK